MKKEVSDSWELEEPIFKKVIDKIKKKGKKVYILFTKAGNKYKNAIFQYMKKLIKTEQDRDQRDQILMVETETETRII